MVGPAAACQATEEHITTQATFARRVLIAGGGASGVLLAVHLLRRGTGATVTLIERRPELGAGIAYGTAHPAHLLNVRAAGMSAFPDDPDHFWRWAQERTANGSGRPAGAQDFAPRQLYRHYLDGLLDPYRTADASSSRLAVVQGEATRAVHGPAGIALHLEDGRMLEGDVLVLATGNEGPPLPPAPWRRDGWSGGEGIDRDARVVIAGTGLTMVDQVQALLYAGHKGPITAVSRHGLTPHRHAPVQARAIALADLPCDRGLSGLLAALRRLVREAECAGQDWRSIVDGLRPHTAVLWQGLDLAGKRRFLRHARAYWDIHRHRIAPDAHERLAQGARSGQFRVLAAYFTGFVATDTGVLVQVRPRGEALTSTLEADIVFECRGRATRVAGTVNPLLRHLLDTGRVHPDATGLGLAVTDELAVLGADGRPSPTLFAIGPLTSGVFWESTAVPDIRQQAVRLAQVLAGGPPDRTGTVGEVRVAGAGRAGDP